MYCFIYILLYRYIPRDHVLTNQHGLNDLYNESPKEQQCEVTSKFFCWVLPSICFTFLHRHRRTTTQSISSFHPNGHFVLAKVRGLNNIQETFPAKYFKIGPVVLDKEVVLRRSFGCHFIFNHPARIFEKQILRLIFNLMVVAT